MDRNKAIDILRVIAPPRTSKEAFYDFMEARDMAIAALEQTSPPAQPTITHEQAINYLRETGWLQNHDRILTESKIVPKRGKWNYFGWYSCSECGYERYEKSKFCPDCGADMREK